MPIRDQPQYKKLEVELRSMHSLRFLRPLLFLFGKKGRDAAREMGNQLKKIPKLEAELERLRELPDLFNDCFRGSGWIATDDLDVDMIEEALKLQSEQGLAVAEEYLEDSFNEQLDSLLPRFCGLPRIRPRRELLELALDDHKAGRYHASVPVVLSQIDGIVFDLVKKSFYERGKNKTKHLRANETIVGDPSGLAALANLLSESRPKTTDVPINLPYRHGILHGRELGYATRGVSTKAFATLIALRPWVLAVDRGEQYKEPEPYFDPATATWEDVRREWAELWEVLREYAQRDKDSSGSPLQ